VRSTWADYCVDFRVDCEIKSSGKSLSSGQTISDFLCRSICTVINRAQTRNPRGRIPHIARRTYLPSIARTPGFPLGEISRLGLDRAEGRKSVVLISTLFRGSFEVNIVIFLEVGRVAGLSEARDPIVPITFRPDWNFELALVGRHPFEKGTTDVRHPMRVPGVTQTLCISR
jgi:hypothetical protein